MEAWPPLSCPPQLPHRGKGGPQDCPSKPVSRGLRAQGHFKDPQQASLRPALGGILDRRSARRTPSQSPRRSASRTRRLCPPAPPENTNEQADFSVERAEGPAAAARRSCDLSRGGGRRAPDSGRIWSLGAGGALFFPGRKSRAATPRGCFLSLTA